MTFVRSLRSYTERVIFDDGACLAEDAAAFDPTSIAGCFSGRGAEEKLEEEKIGSSEMDPKTLANLFVAHVEFALETREFRRLDISQGALSIVEVRGSLAARIRSPSHTSRSPKPLSCR